MEKADFEKDYLAYLDEVVKTIRTRVNEEKPVKFSQLERQLKENPEDADLNARMAYEHFARRDYKEARPLAEKALELKPHHPLASYVKARLLVTIGDDDAALALLEPALDPKRPDERVVDLLAELKMKAGQLDEAEKLYELARKDDPYHTKWIAGLARVHLRQKSTAKFLDDLAMIAANDADDISVRKALAERNLAGGNTVEAEKWAEECLHIDVYDPAVHVLLADAQSARQEVRARRSRSTRPPWSSRPRGPMTSRSSSPKPSLAWASATPPRRRSTASSRPTRITRRPRHCASRSITRPAAEAAGHFLNASSRSLGGVIRRRNAAGRRLGP